MRQSDLSVGLKSRSSLARLREFVATHNVDRIAAGFAMRLSSQHWRLTRFPCANAGFLVRLERIALYRPLARTKWTGGLNVAAKPALRDAFYIGPCECVIHWATPRTNSQGDAAPRPAERETGRGCASPAPDTAQPERRGELLISLGEDCDEVGEIFLRGDAVICCECLCARLVPGMMDLWLLN